MKTVYLVPILSCFLVLPLQAQLLTAAGGLDKINNNLEKTMKNKNDYGKNLEYIRRNVTEIERVKNATAEQKKSVNGQLLKSSDLIKKISQQERELNSRIAKENENINLETKQLVQLESLITQVKKNLEQRRLIITDYQNQLTATGNNKNAWKEREAQLQSQESQSTEALRGINAEETTWISKKKKFEGEAKHWTAEAEKQQKIHDTYQVLAEGR